MARLSADPSKPFQECIPAPLPPLTTAPSPPLPARPTLGESLKWGWVQFLAAFAALWWLAARFEAAVFGLRLLPTRVVSDAAPPSKGAR